jgi:hypothetical protein
MSQKGDLVWSLVRSIEKDYGSFLANAPDDDWRIVLTRKLFGAKQGKKVRNYYVYKVTGRTGKRVYYFKTLAEIKTRLPNGNQLVENIYKREPNKFYEYEIGEWSAAQVQKAH